MQLQLATSPHVLRPDGSRLPLAARDAALLAWLALEGPTAPTRLAELLWPQSTPEAARNSLRQRRFQLKRALGADVIEGQASYALAPGVAHDLADAATLMAAEVHVFEGEFGDWLRLQRERLAERHRRALAQAAEAAEAARDWHAALALAAQLLEAQPLSEAAHRRLIRLHYLAGDRAAALLAFDHCERLMRDEVGATPSEPTLALLRTVQAAAGSVPAPLPMPRTLPAALLRPPRMVGRDAEASALQRVLGRGGRAVVVGEAGMGKSRLLAEVAAAAPRPVVLAQARPGDAAVPYATLARALRTLEQAAPGVLAAAGSAELARLLPELNPAAAWRSADLEGARLLAAVQAVFQRADATIGAFVLDDLHFSDEASALLLREAWDEPPTPAGRAARVLATRPLDGAAAPAVAALCRAFEGGATAVPLQPLDLPAVQALLQSLALADLDVQPAALLRHTGGNPLFLLETLRQGWELAAQGGLALGRPAGVTQVIAERLRQLSPEAVALARLAALAGPDFGIELAEALLHTPALRLADAWSELESAQVLRGAQFAHDLVFEAVLAGVPATIARHSHRSLAQWLAQHGGEPGRVAEHWLAAGEPGRSVEPLLAAAEQARARAFVAQARALLERAVQAAQASGRREAEFRALDALCHNYVQSDPGAAHDAACERLAALAATPAERLQARVADHHRLRRRLQAPPAADLDRDLAEAAALGDEELLVDLAAAAIAGSLLAGDVERALALTERHAALLEREPDLFARAERHGNLSVLLANQDRLAEADAQVRLALVAARQAGDANEVMTLMVNRLRILRVQGRAAALAWLAEIDREHAAQEANPRAWLQSRFAACETLRDAGRLAEAHAALNQGRERVPTLAGALAPAWDCAEAGLWLELGQHARAAAAAQRLAQVEVAFTGPAWLLARMRLTRAQVQARLAGQGQADRPDEQAWALLDAAAAAAPRDSRRYHWFDVVLQRAAWAEPAVGSALAEGVAAGAQAQGFAGYAQRAWWLAAERHLDDHQPEQARRCAAQAQRGSTAGWPDSGAPGAEPVLATGGSTAWVLGVALRLQQQTPEAVRAQLQQCAQALPEAWHEAFWQRQPAVLSLQRALAAAAAASAASGSP